MTKLCPLCNEELERSQHTLVKDQYYIRYMCLTDEQLGETWASSHYIENESQYTIIIISPFKIVSFPNPKEYPTSIIYQWNKSPVRLKQRSIGATTMGATESLWIKILECPYITPDKEDNLRNKIETLITFS